MCVCMQCFHFFSSNYIVCWCVASTHNDLPNPPTHPLTKTKCRRLKRLLNTTNNHTQRENCCFCVHWAVQTTASFLLSEVWLRDLQDSHMAYIWELLHSLWNAAAGHDDRHRKTCQHGCLTFDKAVSLFTHKSLGKNRPRAWRFHSQSIATEPNLEFSKGFKSLRSQCKL